jgi:hypothetical protein
VTGVARDDKRHAGNGRSNPPRPFRAPGRVGAGILLLCLAALSALAQPDPRQMSGIPRPDPNLSDGSITVRVIRGSFANNVAGQVVELRAGDRVSTADTDAEGRATFMSLNPGEQVTVATELDGAVLESLPFAAPGRGGVAVLLVGVAGDAGDADPRPAARPGRVTLSQESRILLELGEEQIEVYYLLDVFNQAAWPVEPDPPFEFPLPPGAQAGTVLQGSTPRTLIDGPRVWVQGAFEPGVTPVQVASILPYSGESLVLSQAFPANFEQLLVFVEKWGTVDVTSAQFERRGEMTAAETGRSALIWGTGRGVSAGQPVVLELSGLPHHSGWPRIIALSLSGLIAALSIVGSVGAGGEGGPDRREALERRREKLFTELVKVERQHRQGRIGPTRYGTRRAELIDQLQVVLVDLDDEPIADAAPAVRLSGQVPA